MEFFSLSRFALRELNIVMAHMGDHGKTALSFAINFSANVNITLKASFSHLLSHKSKGGHPGHHFKVTPLRPSPPQVNWLPVSSTHD